MTQFMPHGMCYLWRPEILWLHVVSDAVIAISYFAIPLALLYLVQRKKQDLPFHWMFLFFATFIVACGATHVMNIWNVWNPDYWASGAVKAVTAVASLGTAVLLAPMLPRVVALQNPVELERMNASLLRREQQLEEAQAIARIGSWELDPREWRATGSSEAYRILGLDPGPGPFAFDALTAIVHPEDRDPMRATVRRAAAGKMEAYEHDYRIRPPDGGERIVQGRGRVIRGEDGSVERIVGTIQDLTETRRTEREIRLRGEQLAEAQEIAHLGSWEWEVDANAVQWSDEMYRIYGLAPGSIPITFEEYVGRIHPEDRDRVTRTISGALADGASFDFEERILRPDGTVRILESKGYTVVDGSGRAVRMVGTCHDVTDARRAEEARYESDLRYQAIFDQAYGFVAILDPRGGVVDVNRPPLEAAGARREDVVGHPLWESAWWSWSEEERRVLRGSIERALEGEVVREERPYRLADDQIRVLDRSIKSVRDLQGEVRYVIVEGRDVTEVKEAERSVHLLARAGDVLGASLELDTILNQIAGLVVGETATVCFFDLLEDGRIERAACRHADAGREDLLTELPAHVPSLDDVSHPIVRVIGDGRSILVPEVDEAWLEEVGLGEGHVDLLRRIGFESLVCVPLVARGEILGALTCARTREAGRRFAEDDRRLLEELGRRVGVAMENARLYEALSRSEEQFRRIVETASEGVWTIDAGNVTAYVNERMADLLGWTAEEMIGRSMYDFMGDSERERASRNVERRKAGIAEQHEFRLRRKDGTPVWTYMSTSPLTDEEGNYVGALAMVTDMTRLKEAQESLRASEERYRFLAENSTDMITRHAPDGTCTYASPSAVEVTGYAPEELVGRRLDDVMGIAEERDEERFVEALETHGTQSIVGPFRRKDGKVRWAEASYRTIRDEETDEIEALLAVTRDVTERIRQERLVHLLQRITATANEATTAAAALESTMREIAEFMEWPLAHAWIVSEDDPELLRPTGIWHDARPGVFEAFREATEATTFALGETLPGRAMESREPEWIADVRIDEGFRRIDDVADPEVVAAFALPVVVRGDVLAVLEFFHDREAEPESRILRILGDAGHQLGQVILRQRAEERLLQREAQLAEAQRIAGLGSWTWDPTTDCVAWSRELYRIYGLDPDDDIDRDGRRRPIHPDDIDEVDRVIEEALASRDTYSIDYRIVRSDGKVRSIHAEGQVVRAGDGEAVRVVGTAQDITERMRIEERLRRSEEDYRLLAEYASDLILRFTPEGVITYASPAAESMVGVQPTEVVGAHAAEFVHSEDLEQVADVHQRLLKEEGSRSVLFRLRHRDGSLPWVESTSRAVRDPGTGRVQSIVSICRDVTENVETARAVRLLERVAALANQAKTSREAMRRALELVCEHAGWPIGHAHIPQRSASGESAPLHLWHVEDPERFEAFRERTAALGMGVGDSLAGEVLETGRPAWVIDIRDHPGFAPLHDVEDPGVHSAFAFPVEAGGQTLAVMEFFSAGPEEPGEGLRDVMRHVGSNLGQVVRRQRSEEALRASELRFRALAESASDAIVTADERGTIVYCNDSVARIFGYQPRELVGRSLVTLMPERFRREHEAGLERFLETREPRMMGSPVELVGRRKDGREIPVELSLGWWESDEGTFFTGVLRDISERKRVEEALNDKMEELARSNSELALFTYVASHDLREPLRTVASNVQLVARRLGDEIEDANLGKPIDFALGGVRRMQDLIDDLLIYSRVGTEGRPFERFDAAEAVEEAKASVRTAIEESGGRVVVEGDLPGVLADRSQLVQLFQNLFTNALKYAREGEPPEVRISAVREGGDWEFRVRDNGIGIPEDFQEHVFTIFQRLHSDHEIPGTGIGLAVCRKIVERHGGRIWVESVPGEGSSFRFTLPAR